MITVAHCPISVLQTFDHSDTHTGPEWSDALRQPKRLVSEAPHGCVNGQTLGWIAPNEWRDVFSDGVLDDGVDLDNLIDVTEHGDAEQRRRRHVAVERL